MIQIDRIRRRSRGLASCLLSSLLSGGLLAGGLAGTVHGASEPAPEEERSVPAGEDLSEALEELRARAGAPALFALALQDSEIVAWGVAGVRAEGSKARATIDDPVHLGSCAKAMTATLIARLIEDGLLSWDTTIADALPELAKKIDAGYHGVTVEDLLHHRGGIAERRRPEISALHLRLTTLEGTPSEVRRAILAEVLASPPELPAEGGFDYSNFGYMLAGAMVERLAERPWEELMGDKLFGPLGMRSAGIGSPSGPDVPVGHRPEDDALLPLPPGPSGNLPDAMGPAGLVHSSLADWGKFVAQHLAGERGEDGLLTAASFKRLHRDPGSSGYAGGWGISTHSWSWGEGQVLSHNGSDNTWYSVVFAMPEWDLTVLTASNCGDTPGQLATTEARDLLLKTLGFRD